MRFDDLLAIVGDEPVFETGLLLAGQESPGYVRRQISGWVSAGKLWQLRRGLYTLSPPYRQSAPHPFLVANRLVSGSCVSLQAALGHYGMIPEHVAAVTSVTTGRPGRWLTPLGAFIYRHIAPDLFTGIARLPAGGGRQAAIATPGKALLDLVYLERASDVTAYLESLRLQNLDQIDLPALTRLAEASGRPRLRQAAALIAGLAAAESEGYAPL
jgi:hypothetical protein